MKVKLCILVAILASSAFAVDQTYVGWVSDSGCALARASSGSYTATNPDCARRCVKEGKKIVLISGEQKNGVHDRKSRSLKIRSRE